MKYVSFLLAGLFLVPSLSFAQTVSPPSRTALLEELATLEAELIAALQSTPTMSSSTTNPASIETTDTNPESITQFNSEMSSLSSDCNSGTQFARCEVDETELTSFLQTQAIQGLTTSDQTTETTDVNSELSKLEMEYSGVALEGSSAEIIEAQQSVFSNETQPLQDDITLLSDTIPSDYVAPVPCTGFNGQGMVNGVVMQYACGFPTTPVYNPCSISNEQSVNIEPRIPQWCPSASGGAY